MNDAFEHLDQDVRMFDDDTCVRCTRIASTFQKKSVDELMAEMEDERDAAKGADLKAQWDEAETKLARI